jgi:hypothetical protein
MKLSFIENITVACDTCGDTWLVSQATFNAFGYSAGAVCTPCEQAWYRARNIR